MITKTKWVKNDKSLFNLLNIPDLSSILDNEEFSINIYGNVANCELFNLAVFAIDYAFRITPDVSGATVDWSTLPLVDYESRIT